MAVYSNFLLEAEGGIHAESLPPVDVESLVDDKKIEAAWEENSYDAAMRAVAENTINFNNIMEACAIQEFCYFEENGYEMVYTEASGEGFWNSVKNFFKKIWEKIQSIFKKVIMQFNSWTLSDKEFLKKYEKDIRKNLNTADGIDDVDVKVYSYTAFEADDADTIGNAVSNAAAEGFSTFNDINAFLKALSIDATESAEKRVAAVKTLNDNPEKITDRLDTYRSALIKKVAGSGSSNVPASVSANEFLKELAEAIQGDTTKDSKKLTEAITPALKFLTFSDKAKSKLGKVLTENKRSIDQSIKTVTNLQKQFDKDTKEDGDTGKLAGANHTLATKLISAMKSEKNILVQFNGACLQHLKAASRQSKAVCTKAATYISKKSTNESGYVQTESNISLLDSVELI